MYTNVLFWGVYTWLSPGTDSRVASLDFGGVALCTLYFFLGSVSRGVGTSLGGFWRVLEVWAYEVLGMYPPANIHENEEVRWHTWDAVTDQYLERSRELTQGWILLDSPYGWQWYLGERVPCQSLRLVHFRIPGRIPPSVQRTDEYTQAEVERYIVLYTVLPFSSSSDYEGFLVSHLASFLDMETRIAAMEMALPVLRREIEVQMPGGMMGVLEVPRVAPPLDLTSVQIPASWASESYQLNLDLEALVCWLMIGDVPEVQPRVEGGRSWQRWWWW
ncbi:hypothetical protein Vadar_002866 [Vaccinium darrowii]|uniref:Uncharacterized protein n=1 Tax=Vaccinium darrowii TaxID=229202 RepID=A0ACB7WXF6_9ERIC|nr:hypothetical protein Vadar_002866 [Vaccinium darrowii]